MDDFCKVLYDIFVEMESDDDGTVDNAYFSQWIINNKALYELLLEVYRYRFRYDLAVKTVQESNVSDDIKYHVSNWIKQFHNNLHIEKILDCV